MKGIAANGTVAGRKVWTSQEVSKLRIQWGSISPATLGRDFPGRTWDSVRIFAHRIGLGTPHRGLVSLTEAARRSGYERPTLARILESQGVRVRRRWGQSPRTHRRLVHRVVDWEQAKAAVERHLAAQLQPRWQWLSHLTTREAA